MLTSIFLLLLCLSAIYLYFTWNFKYWRKRQIFGPAPLPFFGNYPKSAVLLQNIIYEQQNLYEKYKEKYRFIGIYEGRKPKLLILDPELVSDIYVKLFKHFQINDSSNSYDKELDPIFVRNIFAMNYNEWRSTRTELSPAFSQNKLRHIFPLILCSGYKMNERIDAQFDNTSSKIQTFNVKELASRFTAESIINCTYGLDATSTLHSMLVKWFRSSLIKNIGNVILSAFPAFEPLLKQRFFPLAMTQWFYDIWDVAIQQRHQMQTNRMDFLQFLLERKQIKGHSNRDMAAFAASFIFDGFETSGIMLAQALYHIARNDRCQTELRSEIIKYLPYESCATIDMISEMPYLDNVVNETLRIAPSAFLLAKTCTQPIELTDFDGKTVLIDSSTTVQFPVYAIHHDERFYDAPNSFRPERFELQSVNEFKKRGQFLPFGDGSRACLGQKFAILQLKVALVSIVRHYTISVNSKTVEPIVASSLDALLTPISDIYLDFQRID